MNVTFVEDQTYNVEGDIPAVEGASITFACTYWGTPSSPSAAAYRNNSSTAVTSTVFPANSPSASGYVVTLSPATGLTGPARYIIDVTATVGGDVHVKKIKIITAKKEVE